ncbi:Predicted Zn-dependent metalloprotease, SprT family [Bowdeniella nasicola]|uniref:Predicted Zn-dependent metalloprotease, SprT family n=1 Tax=Bowdeniella nasicola TaxID=208480 RepID=A0A1H4D831_9ACTO|nr:SprT-like domain-containing protein [Bowdeniella nasicola]SEA68973.1 Predicted Zn-dependent metalloprotease, SprT family [Bowdeniella nasicola]
MDLNELRDFALTLMREHDLQGWTFGYDRATRRAGLCNYTHHKITVSRHLMRLYSEAEAKDTVIHEVAHAIAGPLAGHGPIWKHVARSLGGSASVSVGRDAPRVPPKYRGVCACGREFHRMRLPSEGLLCKACALAGMPGEIMWFKRAG